MTTAQSQKHVPSRKTLLGIAVKDETGAKIGVIQDIVHDTKSDQIVYAVVGFGGFLGFGNKYHPIPWSALDYVPEQNAYKLSVPVERLQAAPADNMTELTRDEGRSYRDRSYEYYGVSRFWR